MANKDRPIGFIPKGEPLRANSYVAASAIYPGDLVKLDNAGKVSVCSAGAAAALGAALSYASADGQAVLVADHPDQLFVAQTDDATVAAQTDINLNYNIVAGTASTLYKISRHEIDGNTGATDSNLPIKILAVTAEIGEALGTNAKVVCKINNHNLAGGTGTLGV